jgi:hypothetical protein
MEKIKTSDNTLLNCDTPLHNKKDSPKMAGMAAPAALARSTYIRYSTIVVKGRSMRFKMAMAALNRSLPPADKKSQVITLVPFYFNSLKHTKIYLYYQL